MFPNLAKDIGNNGLDKIIEKELLQRLINSFSVATRLRVSVTDVDGSCVLSSEAGDSTFCRLIKSIPEGLEHCMGSYARAGRQAAKWNEPYIFRCHAGLIAWVCPINSGGQQIGNINCGQVLLGKPEDFIWSEILERTDELGCNQEQLAIAARELEVVSPHQVQAAADLLFVTANYLAQSGTTILNYQQQLRTIGSWFWSENHKHQDEAQPGTEVDERQILQMEEQIFNEIRQTNTIAAKHHLDKLALRIFILSNGQLEIIKGYSIEFISSLARFATECGVKFEASIRNSILRIRELEEADTVEKVLLWLLTIGNNYIDLLTEKNSDESDLVIKRALLYISQNYASHGLSLKEVARAIYVSPPYLSRLFKKRKGYNLTEHINKVRVDQAKALLKQPGARIVDVAKLTGFSDRSYFCKVFKQLVGVSPNEYRKKAWT